MNEEFKNELIGVNENYTAQYNIESSDIINIEKDYYILSNHQRAYSNPTATFTNIEDGTQFSAVFTEVTKAAGYQRYRNSMWTVDSELKLSFNYLFNIYKNIFYK